MVHTLDGVVYTQPLHWVLVIRSNIRILHVVKSAHPQIRILPRPQLSGPAAGQKVQNELPSGI